MEEGPEKGPGPRDTPGRGDGGGGDDNGNEGARPETTRTSVSHVAAVARAWATICRAARFC